jgi:3-(3-hydroxy-phenyl)propionate hydroxylase
VAQSIPDEVDVLVVGYGPVGATLACLLGLYGVRTLVIDKASDIHTGPRAIALDNEGLRILQMAGLHDQAFERIVIPQVQLRSRHVGHIGRINMRGTIDGHPQLVTFYQPDLERALRSRAQAHPSVIALTDIELLQFKREQGRILAELMTRGGQRRWVTANMLVGADGAHSQVRKEIGQEFVGRQYVEDWLIIDAKNVPNNIDHVEFICNSRHPTPHMCAPGGRTRWEFMLACGESPNQMTTDESIKRLLEPWGPLDEIQIERKAVYRFAARSCDRYSQGSAFLVGDAAHITPPFAGQGLVSGLRDAANLAWKLAWVLQDKADRWILDTYDEERRPHVLKMIVLARAMGQLITPGSVVKAVLIQGFVKFLGLLPPVRRFLEENKMKPKNQFESGWFVRGGRRLRHGTLIPQFRVRTSTGATELSDNLFGPYLTFVAMGVDAGALLSAATRRAWGMHGGRIVALRLPGSPSVHFGSDYEVIDGQETLPNGLAAGWCAVVRPDRVIVNDGPAENAEQLLIEALDLLDAPRPGEAVRARSAANLSHEGLPY